MVSAFSIGTSKRCKFRLFNSNQLLNKSVIMISYLGLEPIIQKKNKSINLLDIGNLSLD